MNKKIKFCLINLIVALIFIPIIHISLGQGWLQQIRVETNTGNYPITYVNKIYSNQPSTAELPATKVSGTIHISEIEKEGDHYLIRSKVLEGMTYDYIIYIRTKNISTITKDNTIKFESVIQNLGKSGSKFYITLEEI